MGINSDKKNLEFLIRDIKSDVECICGDMNTLITSIEYDSRKVFDGALFIAVKGFVTDGHNYIRDAVDSGAAAVLISQNRVRDFIDLGIWPVFNLADIFSVVGVILLVLYYFKKSS